MSTEATLARAVELHQRGSLDEAAHLYQIVLVTVPSHFDALHLLGVINYQRGHYTEAERLISMALAGQPSKAEALAHSNYGLVLRAFDRNQEALTSFDRALALKPDFAEAQNNRGSALLALGRYEEALASYDQTLALRERYPEAHINRSVALRALARKEEALASCDRAIALAPGNPFAHYNRGLGLQALSRNDEAISTHETALSLKPDLAAARIAACMAELLPLYEDQDEIGERREAYRKRLQTILRLHDATILRDLAPLISTCQPFYLAYQGHNDRDLQLLYGELLSRVMAARFPPATLAVPPAPSEPIRVGIVSGYFRGHSNWKLPIKGWLSRLDRRKFRLFGYHTGSRTDAETQTAAALCERFVQGPLSIGRWREEIAVDCPHVMIYPEVGMDDAAAQLAAQRLAPVQCNSWGHPETSGFPTLDYYLSGDLMEASDGQDHYSERLVRLANLSVYVEPSAVPPVRRSRREFGLRESATIFWCGQSLYKYLPQFDAVFPRIAGQVEDCHFVFIEFDGAPHITDQFRKRLERAFTAAGLRSTDYCLVLPRLKNDGFLAASGLADIYLDSIGWSGCNSTLECLAHDLPIVTLEGSLMRSRHSAAILRMMDVTETIVGSIDDYVCTATRLAKDDAWRRAVKEKVAANKFRVFRDEACIRSLENFLESVVRPERS